MSWISEVAKATGKTEQTVRLAIQKGWEIGTAIKPKDSKVYTYIPHPQKIKELIGIDIGGKHGSCDHGNCAGNCTDCHTGTEKG